MTTDTDRADGVDLEALAESLPKGHAADHTWDVLLDLEEDLYRGDNPADAVKVVEFLDAAIRALHVFRDAAVQEHRRRTDAALARHKELLGSCVCPQSDTLAICPEHGYHGETEGGQE